MKSRPGLFAAVGLDFPTHHRLKRIPLAGNKRAAAAGAWLAALCETRRQEKDGFVDAESVELLVSTDVVTSLVEVGLFIIDEKDGVRGYRVERYELWNETKSEIEERRRKDRERKRDSQPIPKRDKKESIRKTKAVPTAFQSYSTRNPNGGHQDSRPQGIPVSSSFSVSSDSSLSGEPERGPVNETDDGAMGLAVAAWCDGVRSVTGRPHTRILGKPLQALLESMRAHKPANAEPVEWMRQKGAAFASSVRGDPNPFKFGDWLDGGERSSHTRLAYAAVQPPASTPLFKTGDGVT